MIPWSRAKLWPRSNTAASIPASVCKSSPTRVPYATAAPNLGGAKGVDDANSLPAACSLGLSATSQQYFSLTTNQPLATSQQYFSLRTNQHQPLATSQTNRLQDSRDLCRPRLLCPRRQRLAACSTAAHHGSPLAHPHRSSLPATSLLEPRLRGCEQELEKQATKDPEVNNHMVGKTP
jgi:hypothetical protein